jgi:hypothetical protein
VDWCRPSRAFGETELAINGALAFSVRSTGAAFLRFDTIGEEVRRQYLEELWEGGKIKGIPTSTVQTRVETGETGDGRPKSRDSDGTTGPLPLSLCCHSSPNGQTRARKTLTYRYPAKTFKDWRTSGGSRLAFSFSRIQDEGKSRSFGSRR